MQTRSSRDILAVSFWPLNEHLLQYVTRAAFAQPFQWGHSARNLFSECIIADETLGRIGNDRTLRFDQVIPEERPGVLNENFS